MAKTLVPTIDPRSSVAHRIVARVATSPTGISVLRNVGPRVDPALVRFSGGRLSCVSPFPTLLMSHIGAKSGISRTTAVVYFTDAGRVILIASNLGSSQHPAWYHNVRANPEVVLFGRGFSGRFRAEEITGRARDDLFQRAKDADSPYGWYERAATPRRIPVVAFSPLD
jgi:deazaflavin-dependent oxidoreductase (nitroreductase family)